MSTEKNKHLVRRFYEEIVSGAKVDELSAFLSPDYVEIHNDNTSGELVMVLSHHRHVSVHQSHC